MSKKDKAHKPFNAGDIILYRGDSLLSRSIRFVMERYRRKLKLPKRTIFNHAAMIISYNDILYVAEANKMGIEINPFVERYLPILHKVKIISPKKPYSSEESAKVSDTAISYAFEPTRYDFFNFFFQIKMVLRTNKSGEKHWAGPKGQKATKRLYCTEAVATWSNAVRPNTFNKPWSVNPLDVDLNRFYKEIYNGINHGLS